MTRVEVIHVQVVFLLLLLGAFVCFVLAAFGVRTERRPVNFVAVGLALWVLVPLIRAVMSL